MKQQQILQAAFFDAASIASASDIRTSASDCRYFISSYPPTKLDAPDRFPNPACRTSFASHHRVTFAVEDDETGVRATDDVRLVGRNIQLDEITFVLQRERLPGNLLRELMRMMMIMMRKQQQN